MNILKVSHSSAAAAPASSPASASSAAAAASIVPASSAAAAPISTDKVHELSSSKVVMEFQPEDYFMRRAVADTCAAVTYSCKGDDSGIAEALPFSFLVVSPTAMDSDRKMPHLLAQSNIHEDAVTCAAGCTDWVTTTIMVYAPATAIQQVAAGSGAKTPSPWFNNYRIRAARMEALCACRYSSGRGDSSIQCSAGCTPNPARRLQIEQFLYDPSHVEDGQELQVDRYDVMFY